MNSKEIWIAANKQTGLIRAINRALLRDGDINNEMNQLKRHIPCLIGVDDEERVLVFKSSDDGVVGILAKEQGGTFALALDTNITLEEQGFDMEIQM